MFNLAHSSSLPAQSHTSTRVSVSSYPTSRSAGHSIPVRSIKSVKPPVVKAVVPASIPMVAVPAIPKAARPEKSYGDARFLSHTGSLVPPPTPSGPSRRAPSIRESSLRPPVPADSRLINWSSPFSQALSAQVAASLPDEVIARSRFIVLQSLAPNTRSTYAAGLLRFTQFCDRWDIPEADRMPASPDLLIGFISQYAGFFGGSTFNLWLSSLRCWHILHCAPWYGDDEQVKMARTAATRLGTSFKKP